MTNQHGERGGRAALGHRRAQLRRLSAPCTHDRPDLRHACSVGDAAVRRCELPPLDRDDAGAVRRRFGRPQPDPHRHRLRAPRRHARRLRARHAVDGLAGAAADRAGCRRRRLRELRACASRASPTSATRITCSGRVVEKLRAATASRCVRVELQATNQYGERKVARRGAGRAAARAADRLIRKHDHDANSKARWRWSPARAAASAAPSRSSSPAKARASSSTTSTPHPAAGDRGRRSARRGGEAVACVGSVTAPDFAERFVGTAVDSYKGLDIIVNNAGYTWDNVIQKMTDEQWYAMLDVHLTAPFRILRAAAGFIRAGAQEGSRGRAATCSARWSTSRRSRASAATPARPTTRRPRPASSA